MKFKICHIHALALLVLVVYSRLGIADSDWMSPELGVFTISVTKNACDRSIPGFRDETDQIYTTWKNSNSSIIAKAETLKFGGLPFSQAVEKHSVELVKLDKVPLTAQCNELKQWLTSPLN